MGDIAQALGVVVALASRAGGALEVRHFGFSVLQFLVSQRWREVGVPEQQQLAATALQLLKSVAAEGAAAVPYAVRCKAAVLVADLAQVEGEGALRWLMPEVFQLGEGGGAAGAEAAALVLRWLPEEAASSGVSAQGRRGLLGSLLEVVSQILPFLYRLLEAHYSQAVALAQRGDAAAAEEHGAVVTAVLEATCALAEWAPVVTIVGSGILHACGHLLSAEQFQLGACDVLKQLASRKQGAEEPEPYREAMQLVLESLMAAAGRLLEVEYAALGECEFSTRLCTALGIWGHEHVAILRSAEGLSLYLQQMIAIARHPCHRVSALTQNVWSSVIRHVGQQKEGLGVALPEGFLEALLETIAVKTKRDASWGGDHFPNEFDSYREFREWFGPYRHRYIEVVKLASASYPVTTIMVAGRLVEKALLRIQRAEVDSNEYMDLDAAASILQATLTPLKKEQLAQPSVVPALNGLLQQILAANSNLGPNSLAQYLRFIEAYSNFFSVLEDSSALLSSITKVLSVFSQLPIGTNLNGPGGSAQIAGVNKDILSVRQQASATILVLAKHSPEKIVPHLQPLAEQIQAIWLQGIMRYSERNSLYEALIVVVSSTGPNEQASLVSWLLAPMQQEWASAAWQQDLASVGQFLTMATGGQVNNVEGNITVGGGDKRMALFHEVQLLERVLRRLCFIKKLSHNQVHIPGRSATGPDTPHPFAPHLDWAIPGVMSIVRCLHLTWAPDLQSALGDLQAALQISPAEKAFNLGQGQPGHLLISKEDAEEVQMGVGAPTLGAFRTWLRGMRDSSYQFLGLAASSLGDNFYSRGVLASCMTTAALSGVEFMAMRHIRMFVRTSLTAVVRHCPPSCHAQWLLPWIPQFFLHMHQRLNAAWTDAGRLQGSEGASNAADEVIEERYLREATRDYMSMLLLLVQQPPGTKSKTDYSSTPLAWLLQTQPDCAATMMATAIACLCWPDSDSASKTTRICRAIAYMARKDARLVGMACQDLFAAAVSGLTLTTHADFQAEILLIIRDILVWFENVNQAPEQLLLSLPNITPDVFQNFKLSMKNNPAEKDQRNLVRKLLLRSGASLKALAASQSPGSTIPELTVPKVRVKTLGQEPEDPPPVQLFQSP